MAPHGEDAYAPLGGGGGGGVVDDDDLNEPYDSIPHLGHGADPYGSVASRTSYGGLSTAASAAAAAENPFRRQELQSNPFDPEGSEYLGAGGVAHYGQPAAAQFPPANYDRIGLERPRMG